MLFNSPSFLLIFLPIATVAFHLSPPAFRLYVIIVSSFVFYALAGMVPFAFMVLSILWAFAFTHMTRYVPMRFRLAVAVSFPLWVLFMFRYLEFSLNTFGVYDELAPHLAFFLSVLWPAGSSFYTFQIIGYSIDVLDAKEIPERTPTRIAAFISFFPQLIAGPILRYAEIRDQLTRVTQDRRIAVDWLTAFKFIAIGLCAKVFVADIFAQSNDLYREFTKPTAIDTVYLVFSYSLRIYYDFWSYSIMAIGLGALFGISLPLNFREPYLSPNPKEFWRRWHVTLSYFLRDYVYIRLGGRERYYRNILIIFALVGLWHGAGWNFVAWGLYHAAFVLFYASIQPYWDRMPSPLQVAITFVIVSLSWPLFFLEIASYGNVLASLVQPDLWTSTAFDIKRWLFLAVVMAFVFLARESDWLFNANGWFRFINSPMLHSLMMFAGILGTTWSRTFIYFRF